VTNRTATSAAARPAATAGSRSATGEVSRGGLSRGVGPPGAAALPPGAPGSPADGPGSVAGGGRLGSDAAPEASADGRADAEVKAALRATTDEAVERGVFGAPTMFVGDQMFFGQDRLDFVRDALRR